MRLTIPDFCLVALIGASGSGKSSFARKHFGPTEVISSDYCRGLVADDQYRLACIGPARRRQQLADACARRQRVRNAVFAVQRIGGLARHGVGQAPRPA